MMEAKTFHTSGDLGGFAYHASRNAMQTAGIPHHRRWEFMEDAKQEAAEALLRCNGRSKKYAFVAAHRQVCKWIFEFLREDGSAPRNGRTHHVRVEHVSLSPTMTDGSDPESILIRQEEAVEFAEVLDEVAYLILNIMKSARKQQRGRALEAAVRDTNIILLRLQGYTFDGIAHEIEDSPVNVRGYLRQARRFIESYLVSIS